MQTPLPTIIAGPILRHVSPTEFTLWLVTTQPIQGECCVGVASQTLNRYALDKQNQQQVMVGERCFIQLINIQFEHALPKDTLLEYDLWLDPSESHQRRQNLKQLVPGICYAQQKRPNFRIDSKLNNILHGSCRKPHYPQKDSLTVVDEQLAASQHMSELRPSILIFSGDQIYADDVAGPTLFAIHQVIGQLGLFEEALPNAPIANAYDLYQHSHCYYQREAILPNDKCQQSLRASLFNGKAQPIFTAKVIHNHLVSLAEVIAMYLLVWSDTPWQWVDWSKADAVIPAQFHDTFNQEKTIIVDFVHQLGKIRRAMAHVPVYMMFDDHDVTDDWNLTLAWEKATYQNDFAKRIIGNTLIGYYLCQGWGNMPKNFAQFDKQALPCFSEQGLTQHDDIVELALKWGNWHYQLDTDPMLVVLDTRTHRWRSETNDNQPSGLMDWEALCELQQSLIEQEAVIVVSPAPVFGVKLIEVIQRIFTFFGKPLVVDAENWMAHPGSANAILNIFRHRATPPQFVILSGDVHYSFAYDVTVKYRENSPRILQITASGFKNAFPQTLLTWFDRINRFLFASRSPLNWFTKRRRMRVRRRRPSIGDAVLYNHSSVGQVLMADKIEDIKVRVLTSDGKQVEFE